MLAAISHDLRTPVTLLRLRAEAIANRKERAKLLQTLDEMEAMISSVLEFTKATVLDEPQRQVDLSALLSSICDDMADAGAAIAFEPPNTIPYACRRTSLKRALTNLIDNAAKYGGAAHVTLERRDGEIGITIDDQGPGIPEEQQQHVFMPFHRIDGSRSPNAGGVGLGLSIAQTIIHGHGGRIALQNRAQGGLSVRVTLPA
jgi:signal transduction histidine kinase